MSRAILAGLVKGLATASLVGGAHGGLAGLFTGAATFVAVAAWQGVRP